MPLIEVTDDELAFLRKTAKDLGEQNNQCTADPYYYVVRIWHNQVMAPGHGDKEVRHDCEAGDSFETLEEYVAYLKKSGAADPVRYDDEDKPIYDEEAIKELWDDLPQYSIRHAPEHINVFLTEKAYEDHMRLNAHNYRHSVDKVGYYVMHAFRNPQMDALVRLIKRVGAP